MSRGAGPVHRVVADKAVDEAIARINVLGLGKAEQLAAVVRV
jgi:hypothetical protein